MSSDRTEVPGVRPLFPRRGTARPGSRSVLERRGERAHSVRSHGRAWTAAVYILVLSIAAAAGLRLNRHETRSDSVSPICLAAKFPDRALDSASVSPCGKYLGYSDPAGIGVLEIDTDVVRRLPGTAGLNVSGWTSAGASLQVTDGDGKHWLLPVSEQSEERRRPDVVSTSPDGSQFIVARNGEYLLESVRESRSRRVLSAGPDTPVYFAWSPDGRGVAYARGVGISTHEAGQDSAAIYVFDRATGASWPLVPPLKNRMVSGLVWLPDGRVVFAATRAVFAEAVLESNLWQVRVNPKTNRPEGDPAQLTNWSGFMIGRLSASADGKRLVYLQSHLQTDAYVADIEDGGRRINPPRRLTLDQRNDLPLDWLPDGNSVVFVSDRLGRLMAFRQALETDIAEPLTTSSVTSGNPRVTADGKWILYIAAERGSRKGPLMRMPVQGGAAHRVIESVTAEAQYRCSISGPCILSDVSEDRAERITWLFDPVAGRGRELFRTRAEDGPPDMSRDGKMAYLVQGRPRNRIRIVSIDGTDDRVLTVRGAGYLNSLDWAADGQGLYTGDAVPGMARLLYVGLDGSERVLWHQPGSWQTWAVPSRDGRRIAILGMTRETAAWMIDGI